jgi:hypothetical protein
MDRRGFFKTGLGLAGAAVVAPKILAEALPAPPMPAPPDWVADFAAGEPLGALTTIPARSWLARVSLLLEHLLGKAWDLRPTEHGHDVEIVVPDWLQGRSLEVLKWILEDLRPAGVVFTYSWDRFDGAPDGYGWREAL